MKKIKLLINCKKHGKFIIGLFIIAFLVIGGLYYNF